MDFKNSDRLLFVCASAGNGGHRLGRIVSCLENVHWYSCKDNGFNPWDVSFNEKIKGKSISAFHYDRITAYGVIPLVGERVEKYWNNDDIDSYYNKVWPQLMVETGADKIINQGRYITWVIHDDPGYVRKRFPNSKILNLIDDDLDTVADRYTKTTSLFPAKIDNKKIKPTSYISEFSMVIEQMKSNNPNPSIRDVWCFKKHKKYFYENSFDAEYLIDIKADLIELNNKKINPPHDVLSLKWSDFKISNLEEYFESRISKNVASLL